MNPLEAVLLIFFVGLPFHLIVQWQLSRLIDPAYLSRQGVVIRREEILGDRSEPVGEYRGRPIYGSVTFLGMAYRFDRIVEPWYRSRLGPGELFLEPGVVYLIRSREQDSASANAAPRTPSVRAGRPDRSRTAPAR